MCIAGKYDLQNSFYCDIEKLPPELQMEVTHLQCRDALKDKFKEENFINFYKCLPEKNYSQVRSFARGFISVLANTSVEKK
jgi:hypothetical protein